MTPVIPIPDCALFVEHLRLWPAVITVRAVKTAVAHPAANRIRLDMRSRVDARRLSFAGRRDAVQNRLGLFLFGSGMNDWVAIDTSVGSNPKVWALAQRLELSVPTAVGHMVILFGAVHDHRPTGKLTAVDAALIEHWAHYERADGKFAAAFRDLFMDGDSLHGWRERNGRFLQARERERVRSARRRRSDRVQTADRPRSDQRHPTLPDRTVPTELQKQLLTDSQKTLVGSEGNGASHETRNNGSSPVQGAVPEQTTLGEAERGVRTAPDQGISQALADLSVSQPGPYNRYSVDANCRQDNELTRTSSETTSHIHIGGSPELRPPNGGLHNAGHGGAAGDGVPGGAENSASGQVLPASRKGAAGTGNGTERHSVAAGTANPVAGNDSRKILPVPDTNSRQRLAGSQSGDAEALPPETTPAGLAKQSGVGVGGGRRARKPKDPLAADECWKWLIPYRAVWEGHFGVGSFAHRIAAPYLGPLHKAQGADVVCANLERYLQRPDIGSPNWSHFSQHFAKYGAAAALRVAPSKPERVCVHCKEPMRGDRAEYDRKPLHAHCLNAWQMAGAMAS